jgi:hypothetical protein
LLPKNDEERLQRNMKEGKEMGRQIETLREVVRENRHVLKLFGNEGFTKNGIDILGSQVAAYVLPCYHI